MASKAIMFGAESGSCCLLKKRLFYGMLLAVWVMMRLKFPERTDDKMRQRPNLIGLILERAYTSKFMFSG